MTETNWLELLEARVLAGASNPEDFERLATAGIEAEDFLKFPELYLYISGSVENLRLIPRLRDLTETFNLPIGLKRNSGQHASDVEELAQVILVRRIQAVTNEAVEEHSDRPSEMLNSMLRSLGDLRQFGRAGGALSTTDASAIERLAKYEAAAQEMAERGASTAGIPTGLSYFDHEFKLGWMPGELIGIVARTFMGKTFIMMNFGVHAWLAGKRVLMINPELSEEEAEARFDMLLAGKKGITSVTLDQLYRGVNPPEDFAQMLRETASQRQDWITITAAMNGNAFAVSDILRYIRQFQPDLVLVDGLMLLKSGVKRGNIWETVIDLCGGLKNIAQGERVPIIVAHQANRSAGNTYRPPRLNEIAGGDAFGWDCDRILALCKYQVLDDEPDPTNYLRLTTQKFRKGVEDASGVRIFFDPGKGQIYEQLNEPERRGSVGASVGAGDSGAGEQCGHGDNDPMSIP